MTLENPYEPPVADLTPVDAPVGEPVQDRGRIIWLVAFGLNLIVPGVLGSGIVSKEGWPGIVAAVLAQAVVGYVLLGRYPRLMGPALKGGFTVALTQFLPVLQFGAGMLAVALTRNLVPREIDGVMFNGDIGIKGGFLATLFCGFELLAMSLVVGWFLDLLFGSRRKSLANVPDFGIKSHEAGLVAREGRIG